jgi:hypothetical protein
MQIELGVSDYTGVLEKYGRKSVIVAEAVVTYGNGMSVTCAIWMSLKGGDLTTEPGLPKGVSFADEDQLNEFKGAIVDHMIKQDIWPNLYAKAEHRITAPPSATTSKGKLVKPIKLVGTLPNNGTQPVAPSPTPQQPVVLPVAAVTKPVAAAAK